jgi:hypothetical protein
MSQGYPNLPNGGVVDAGVIITDSIGTTATTIFTVPSANSSGSPATLGGSKFGKFVAVSTDTTQSFYVQISKVIGGVAYPEDDPVYIPAATAKGTFNTATVDLLTVLYGEGVSMNLAPGTALQAQLSAAPASGKTVAFLLTNGANF